VARTGQAAERVAAEVSDRLERLATAAADAILGSLYAPQVATPTRAQSLAYWRPYFFTPDGGVNQAGRDQVVQQVGGAEYAEIARGLAKELRDEQAAHARVLRLARPPELRTTAPTVFGPRTTPTERSSAEEAA